MSTPRRLILVAVAALVALAGTYVPFEYVEGGDRIAAGYGWILAPPDPDARINIGQVITEWFGVLAIGATLWLAAIPRRRTIKPANLYYIETKSEGIAHGQSKSEESSTIDRSGDPATVLLGGESESAFSSVGGPRYSIWNPSAAIAWSGIFSPLFGSYLHARNWRVLGNPGRAVVATRWFAATLVYSVTYLIVVLSTLSSANGSVAAFFASAAGLALFLLWYFLDARKQSQFVKSQLRGKYDRRGWGIPLLVATAIWAAALGSMAALGGLIGAQHARSDVIAIVNREANESQAPAGAMGAKWLMSVDEVRSIRLGALPEGENVLFEQAEVYGSEATLSYLFGADGFFRVATITWAPSSRPAYFAKQAMLVREYGAMPDPIVEVQSVLESRKTVGKFLIDHSLKEFNGVLVEQLMYGYDLTDG